MTVSVHSPDGSIIKGHWNADISRMLAACSGPRSL